VGLNLVVQRQLFRRSWFAKEQLLDLALGRPRLCYLCLLKWALTALPSLAQTHGLKQSCSVPHTLSLQASATMLSSRLWFAPVAFPLTLAARSPLAPYPSTVGRDLRAVMARPSPHVALLATTRDFPSLMPSKPVSCPGEPWTRRHSVTLGLSGPDVSSWLIWHRAGCVPHVRPSTV
jgi:hypothetical protein